MRRVSLCYSISSPPGGTSLDAPASWGDAAPEVVVKGDSILVSSRFTIFGPPTRRGGRCCSDERPSPGVVEILEGPPLSSRKIDVPPPPRLMFADTTKGRGLLSSKKELLDEDVVADSSSSSSSSGSTSYKCSGEKILQHSNFFYIKLCPVVSSPTLPGRKKVFSEMFLQKVDFCSIHFLLE